MQDNSLRQCIQVDKNEGSQTGGGEIDIGQDVCKEAASQERNLLLSYLPNPLEILIQHSSQLEISGCIDMRTKKSKSKHLKKIQRGRGGGRENLWWGEK